MQTIWKFTLRQDIFDPHGVIKVEMPTDAEIICTQTQRDDICIWAKVDPQKSMSDRYFEVFGTGHSIAVNMGVERKYIGTVQLDGGSLVFHVFERTN